MFFNSGSCHAGDNFLVWVAMLQVTKKKSLMNKVAVFGNAGGGRSLKAV